MLLTMLGDRRLSTTTDAVVAGPHFAEGLEVLKMVVVAHQYPLANVYDEDLFAGLKKYMNIIKECVLRNFKNQQNNVELEREKVEIITSRNAG